ncbi:secreted RxLR effector protein 161-like [Rosa chinensis]|uniref:secreted RxLR effector protein 161-like n=1 Tax=Rosa chinensis TaxID=74649 RepID=UPI001AD8B87F|nr:secreted RxLR effector protein 161-like [Rosa chinensis]
MERSNSVENLIVPGCKLAKDEAEARVDATQYKQMIVSLMDLTATRLDLMYMVSLAGRYMEKPTELHMQAVKRILRYLKGTTELRVCYKKGGEIGKLVAFLDNDYAGDVDDRMSKSGYVFLMSIGAVSWSSKKQPVVTLLTTEAEFIAAASCACHEADATSGIAVHKECKLKFLELKTKRTYR